MTMDQETPAAAASGHAREAQPAPAAETRPTSYKNPILAGVLSLFPGIGNIYNGLYMRGLAFFLICVSMIVITTREPLFGLGIAFFWIFNVVDAYRQATLINHGYGQDLGIDEPPKVGTGQGGVMVGVIMLLIGGFALYDNYFGPIDLDWLIDLWPVFLMAIGAWLIFDAVRDKKRKQQERERAGYE
jgi:TM2 domain-containing membrane protein YozV